MTKRYILLAFGVTALEAGVLMFFPDPIPKVLGLVYGSVIAALMFHALYLSLNRMLTKRPKVVQALAMGSYLFRMAIYALALVVAVKSPSLNLYTATLGLLSVKFAIHLDNVVSFARERR